MNSFWKVIDREALEQEYNVKETAEADAKFNIPDQDAKSPTSCENDIIGKGEEYLQTNRDIGIKELQASENEINAYKRQLKGDTHQSVLSDIKKILTNFKITHLNKIFRKKEARIEAEEEMLRFRKSNRLTRDCDYCTPNKLLLYMTLAVIFFIAEVMLNGKLVGSILPGGENEGKLLALGVAAINVIVAFLIGFYGMKNINDRENKIIFSTIVSLLMIGIFYINWSYGAFRSVAEIEATKMLGDNQVFDESLLPILLQQALRPWDVSFTFQGLLLLAIGFFVAGLSLLEGYFIDDKYPGYGKKTRKLNEIVSNHQESNSGFYAEYTDLKIKERMKLQQETDKLNTILTKLDDKIQYFQSDFLAYTQTCESNESAVNHVLNHYRDQNIQFRATKSPDYFNDIFKYNDKDKDPFYAFVAQKAGFMEDIDRESQTEAMQTSINQKFKIAQEELDHFIKELDLEINESLKEGTL
jgi:hypothetical protein